MKCIRVSLFAMTLTLLLFAGTILGPNAAQAGPNPVVVMETSMGRIIVMLYPKQAPITVDNFLRYVNDGFYDSTIFHRVVRSKPGKGGIDIVQGGGFEFPMKKKRTLGPIASEANNSLLNDKGTIAMARRIGDVNSATSQFYFNAADNAALNQGLVKDSFKEKTMHQKPGFTVFGKVIRGMDVVEKIHQVKTGRSGLYQDVPVKPVYLIRAYQPK
ncbi:peptidylprolyl isomerase [Pseudodesulfovibrio tunisiensis]|uniref:peptidylprolyl isomerase n=1 Tax=Pseudodesulfovibrio tunisiensis TaxID=463192 RepID=UPI001FB2133E|nr:peptidylprolyl isomerase [Pseudodesulfovibrio tunisiensis]